MGIATFPAAGGGVVPRVQDFTTSGTWVVPSGVLSAEFLVVGAGGAGGGVGNNVDTRYIGAGGGGGGAVKKVSLSTTPGNTYTITVGAKGTGVSAGAGPNGGYSEVVLSGTTLIRSYGGGGGQGRTTGGANSTAPETGTKSATGGGISVATDVGQGGGGGGASINTNINSDGITNWGAAQATEGSYGKAAIAGSNQQYGSGMAGIDGFGNGGGGGLANGGDSAENGAVGYGAGAGVRRNATGVTDGNNATVAGCGGGGAVSSLSTSAATGGSGADGLVRIKYYA
jgi:hypothetical protein